MPDDNLPDDIFDYAMSDDFISETCHRPYRAGFRSRRHPWRPSLAYINALPDHVFYSFIQNGCRLPSDEPDIRAELNEVRAELRELKSEMRALRQLMHKPTPTSSASRGGGLNVSARV